VGDRVCYARTINLAAPILSVEVVTEIISCPTDRVKVKMGKKFTFDSDTRIKII